MADGTGDIGGVGAAADEYARRLRQRLGPPSPATLFRTAAMTPLSLLTSVVQRKESGSAGAPMPTNGQDARRETMGRGDGPPRPALIFALPQASRPSVGEVPPSQLATERGGGTEGRRTQAPTPDAKAVDPHAVADRVYDLMTQEVSLAQRRSGRG